MGGNAKDGLKLAGVIIGCIIILGIMFLGIRKGKAASEEAFDQVDNFAVEMNSADFGAYDNTEVRGDMVISAIRKYAAEDFTVTVQTAGGEISYNEPNGYKAKKKNDKDFIEPNGFFDSEIVTNGNGSVVEIVCKVVKKK